VSGALLRSLPLPRLCLHHMPSVRICHLAALLALKIPSKEVLPPGTSWRSHVPGFLGRSSRTGSPLNSFLSFLSVPRDYPLGLFSVFFVASGLLTQHSSLSVRVGRAYGDHCSHFSFKLFTQRALMCPSPALSSFQAGTSLSNLLFPIRCPAVIISK